MENDMKNRKQIMQDSHQIVAALKKLGMVKPPEDSICQTCGDKRKLVAHHWNGNENPTDLWFVCYSCNKILPNGGLTLEQARERCDYNNHPGRRLSSFVLYFRESLRKDGMAGMWRTMADEIYPLLTEKQKQ